MIEPSLRRFIEEAFEVWPVPALGAVVVEKGAIRLCEMFAPQGETPLGEDTLFPYASITKAVAATSISVLAQKGLLRWDDPVHAFCPHFKLSDPWVTEQFQLIDLFCHRAGLGVQPLQQMPLWGYSRADIQSALAYLPFKKSFRTAYEYNNALYLWVEDVVQAVSGQPWAEFVTQEVLQPLGMTNTQVGRRHVDASKLIKGHIRGEHPPHSITPIEFSIYPDVFLAAGGLVGPLQDLATWMLFQLGHTQGAPIIDDGLRRFMQRPQTVIGTQQFYGLGWRILTNRPKRVVTHGGLIKGIKHQLWLIPELDCGIAVLSNLTDCEAAPAICEYFADLAMGLPPAPYHQRFKEVNLAAKRDVIPETLGLPIGHKNLCGRYHHVFLGEGRVSEGMQDGCLHLAFGPRPARATLLPTSEDAFLVQFDEASGGCIGESLWGTATFKDHTLTLRGFNRFDNEIFIFEKVI